MDTTVFVIALMALHKRSITKNCTSRPTCSQYAAPYIHSHPILPMLPPAITRSKEMRVKNPCWKPQMLIINNKHHSKEEFSMRISVTDANHNRSVETTEIMHFVFFRQVFQTPPSDATTIATSHLVLQNSPPPYFNL